jgi:hypothetical protein
MFSIARDSVAARAHRIANAEAMPEMYRITLAACRTQVFDSEMVGERGQILTILTRISGICKEKAMKYGSLSRRCSRIILSPTGC